MEMEKLDIIQLINNSPLTNLSKNAQTNLLTKIQTSFTNEEQQLFVANFYNYLNYNSKTDFIINLEDIWKWCGFSRKDHCKRLLEKFFTKDIDYKILLRQQGEPKTELAPPAGGASLSISNWGGSNKEVILMNINTFKKLCLKANTKRSDQIHDYYLKLEDLLQETLHEQLEEQEKILREKDNLLNEKDNLLIEQREQTKEEKEILLEKTLLNQYPINTQCIYYGKIDNKDTVGANLIKFGMSNNLQERVKTHKKTYINFRLTNVFKVSNPIEIENCIKKHPILKKRIRNIMINDINYRELLAIDTTNKDPDFSLETLDEYIKQIIQENQYNIENYKKLLERNDDLQKEIYNLTNQNKLLSEENAKLQKKVDQFKPSVEENNFKKNAKVETTSGYSLFAFECNNSRYKVGLCRTSNLETRERVYKLNNTNCQIKAHTKIKHPFLEKTLLYLLKRHLLFLNNDTFDGSLDYINLIFSIVFKLEEILINNDLENIMKIFNNEKIEVSYNDPEVPFIKKSKRSVDQIDKDSGVIIATYPSIEAAGRSIGLTTGTAIGNALRNKIICKGFLWRYSGISKEDQMTDQPVIRITCNNGEKKQYPNISSAAKDAKISPPGLRNRILTNVHINGYHWVFDKNATHYINF